MLMTSAYRTALVDVLVDKILMYDDDSPLIEIFCRASDFCIESPKSEPLNRGSDLERLARRERFELPTLCLEGRCSILLSYRRILGLENGRFVILAYH